MPSFSYRKLTELQVQGARDRSLRTVQVSQLKSRKDLVKNKCRQLLFLHPENTTSVEDVVNNPEAPEIFTETIEDTFARDGRDLSPFMKARLANLLDKEYRAKLSERAATRHKDDHDHFVAWIKGQIQEERDAKGQMEDDLKEQVQKLRIGIEQEKRRKIVELKQSLEDKKRALIELKEQKIGNTNRDYNHDHEKNDILMRTELIEFDDGYFCSSEDSEWVSVSVCT
jgi:hypothetical protein